MYESKLQKLMDVYEHMNEYPTRFHDTVLIKNIIWDDEDLENDPELEDTTQEVMDVEYVAEYEGDHRGRTEEIERQFKEFHGCIPFDYDVELQDVEILESADARITKIDDGQHHTVHDELFRKYAAEMPSAVGYSVVFNTNGRHLAEFQHYEDAEIFRDAFVRKHPDMDGYLSVL